MSPTNVLRDTVTFTRAELAVLVSGISSMGLEILAGRMIAPAFGNSIYTWGSIIGVFMAALSLGYHVGGRRSHDATESDVARILALTAGYVAVLLFTYDYILTAFGVLPVPARYASILPLTVLFGPPVYILGLISPYAASLSEKTTKGEASGHVYALGTIGSILGTFLTTFALIPYFPIDQILLGFGIFLIAGSLTVHRPRLREPILMLIVISGALMGGYALDTSLTTIEGTTVYSTQTAYQELEVVDDNGVRTLYLGGQPNSAMYLDGSMEYVFSYTPYFHLPFLLEDDIENVLFIGGGGFSGPKRFLHEYENISIDVVEIDPQVVETAREYFNVTEHPRLETHVMDGREYLDQTEQTYDLIVLDAYKKDKVPFHLATREFLQLADQRLTEDGVVLSNIISAPTGPGSKFFRSEFKTFQQVFTQVQAFKTRAGSSVQNVEIIAWDGNTSLTTKQWQQRNEQRDIGIDLSSQIQYRLTDIRTDDVPALRDEKAPVDRLLDPLIGQEYVIGQQ